MASTLRLTVTGSAELDETDARAAWEEVSAEFDAVDLAMSRFRDDSAVTQLNRLAGSGSAIPVEPRLYAAIATTHRAYRRTGGRSILAFSHASTSSGIAAPPVRLAGSRRIGGRKAGCSAGRASGEFGSSSRSTSVGSARGSRFAGPGGGSAMPWARTLPRDACSRRAVTSSSAAHRRAVGRGRSGSRIRRRIGPDRRRRDLVRVVVHVVDPREPVARCRRPACPSPDRSLHRRTGWGRSACRDGGRCRPGMVRGLDEGPVPGRSIGHRRSCPGTRLACVVGR